MAHLNVSNENICTVQETPSSQDPEDGINARVEDLLNGRRTNSKVDTWEILWQTLFPDDSREAIPDPAFVPPVELDEAHAEFHTDRSRRDLEWRMSDEDLSIPESERHKIIDICEQHIEHVMLDCREAKIGNLPRLSQQRRKRVQKPKLPRGPWPSFRMDNWSSATSQTDEVPSLISDHDSDWGTPSLSQAASLAFGTPAMMSVSTHSDLDVGSYLLEQSESRASPQATRKKEEDVGKARYEEYPGNLL